MDVLRRFEIPIAASLLVLAALIAWSNSFSGPFILDDLPAIADNASIRQWSTALTPPGEGQTVTGRPLLNLSFALNHALGGTHPEGYHALNLAIHAAAALAFFGLMRRTLRSPALIGRLGADATPLAFTAALLWTVHPLQTGSVTYIAQRAESLCALFYLLTLYGFARGAGSARPWRWFALASLACLAGMASKEVMVSAPLMTLLYDRTFFAGTFREAWRRHRRFYLALAAAWLLLGWLVVKSGNRGSTAGFGVTDHPEITSWTYLLKQCEAVVEYLRLCFWPHPLVLDHGFTVISDPLQVYGQGILLLTLFAGTVWALWRQPAWGFLGAWFFVVLAPSSSVVPVITETMAEHRMYLPLAAVIAAIVVASYAVGGRRALLPFIAIAIGLGFVTHRRNDDYRSALAIWSVTAAQIPANARAHQELALAWSHADRLPEAAVEFQIALNLLPSYSTAHYNYADVLARLNRPEEALAEFREADRSGLVMPEAAYGAGNMLVRLGRRDEAFAAYENALRLKPRFPSALNNLANLLSDSGRTEEAILRYREAIDLDPDYGDAHGNLGNAYAKAGRLPEALAEYAEAVRLTPDSPGARRSFGIALFLSGRKAEGVAQLEEAVRLDPANADLRATLEQARREMAP